MLEYKGSFAYIPVGTKGVLSDLAPGQVPADNLTKVINCDYGLGYIQKAPGAITYNRSALSAGIVALCDYWPSKLKQRLFAATSDGNIYRDTGDRGFSLGTAVATGYGNLTNQSQFVVGGNEEAGNDKKLFFFSGGLNQVKVLSGDGTSFLSISQPSADWPNPTISSNPSSFFPSFGLIHRNALWAFAGSTAYMSNPADHEDFVTSNAILVAPVGPGEGGDLIGGFVYKQKLIVFKEMGLAYILDDSDADSANWYFTRYGEGLEIAGWHSSAQVSDDMLFGTVTGSLNSLKATLNFGDFTQGDVFRQALAKKFFAEHTTPMGHKFQHSIYYPDKCLALFTGRTKGRQNNDCLIQLDVSQPGNPKFGLWTHIAADCLALRRDTHNTLRPICGSSDGFVYFLDREDRAVGPMGSGTAYTGEFWTADLDMRHLDPTLAHKNKIWDWLWVTFQEEGNHNLSVDVWIDGRFRETLTVKQTIDTNYCGAFTLGTSVLGGMDEKTIGVQLHGAGRRISFRCYNAGNNQNFKVSMLTVGFQAAGDRVTKLS